VRRGFEVEKKERGKSLDDGDRMEEITKGLLGLKNKNI